MMRVSSSPTDDHEFHAMGARAFELLSQALHEAQDGVFSANTYGETGYAQLGADHIAFRRTADGVEVEVGQSKAHKAFEQEGIKKAVDKFLGHWDDHWKDKRVRRLILFVGCNIKSAKAADEIMTQTLRLAEMGVIFEVWDANGIYRRLQLASNVVRTHLGLPWIEHLFGKPSNPLADIAADLMRNDYGAHKTLALVGQLNQAESARVSELRRRVRLGEAAAVRLDIDQVLTSSSLITLDDGVHADFLRLSAGLYIGEDKVDLAKAQLDQADALDGRSSGRLRAMLCLQSLGPEQTVNSDFDPTDPDLAEVLAVARLRLGESEEALRLLEPGLSQDAPAAETLRIAGLAKLAAGQRYQAVDLARRARLAEADSRACKHLLALALFARAISPSLDMPPSDWPSPIADGLVLGSDEARSDLEEARILLTELAADQALADHREMLAWSFASHVCTPQPVPSADEMLAQLTQEGRLTAPIIVWAMSRGMSLDVDAAKGVIAAERKLKPKDVQLMVIDVAMASFTGDRAAARSHLTEGRQAFIDAGLESYHRYWSAQIDIEDNRTPPREALDEWPWLALRVAMKIRYKKKRLAQVAGLADEASGEGGDPRILLTAVQILFDAGSAGLASKFTDALTSKVGTPEAIALAANVLSRARLHERVVAALDDATPFPGAMLPADLQRLRINSKAALGQLVEAARELSELAAVTGATSDLWTSIEWHLAIGAVSDARSLYTRNKDRLASPAPGHLRLANAVIRSDPKLAEDITRHLASVAPNELVTATYELASRLRLNDEQGKLVRRIQMLGAQGEAGVELISDISVVIERMKKYRQQAEENYDRYCNGHLPLQMLTQSTSFAEIYLGNLVAPPPNSVRPAPLFARYGRRYDPDVWPGRREDTSLVVELSALLTAHGLGLLDMIERAYRPLRVAPDIINTIDHLRQKLMATQPDRIEAARHIVELKDQGAFPDPAQLSPVDTYRVAWEIEDGDPDSTLNFPSLFAAMEAEVDASALAAARLALDETVKSASIGPKPGKGATVILDAGVAIELHLAGALDVARGLFKLAIPDEEIETRRNIVLEAEQQELLAVSLDLLAEKIGTGAQDGTYAFVPVDPKPEADLVRRQYFQCLGAMKTQGSILWIDDRFTTSIDQQAFPTVTTVEVLEALQRHQRLSAADLATARRKLRAAGWTFMPVEGTEIADVVIAATSNGEVVETETLSHLRRSTAWTVLERRRLQWPTPEQAEQGARGEIPYLLDQGHAVADALVRVWNTLSLTQADAQAASSWILAHLDMSATAPMPLGAGDPRAELMVGLHIGHLLLTALQVGPKPRDTKRRAEYIDWLWTGMIWLRVRMYPELLPHILETLEQNLIEDPLEDPETSRFWKSYCSTLINALPPMLRAPLLSRPEMRKTFGIAERGLMTVGNADFDAVEYLTAVVEIEGGETRRLKTTTGRKATLRLAKSDGQTVIVVTIDRRKYEVDDWARRVGSEDPSIRREALQEQAIAIDLTQGELDQLSGQLADLSPPERVMKIVELTGESMAAWYSALVSHLRSREAIGVPDLIPPDLSAAFRFLQFHRASSIEEAQSLTIAAVGLEEAIRRWSAVPVAPGPAFHAAIDTMEEAAVTQLVETFLPEGSPWTNLFVSRLLWARSAAWESVRDVLRKAVLEAVTSEDAGAEWLLLTTTARLVAGEAPQQSGWSERSIMARLAMVWAHAGTLSHQLLAGGLNAKGLTKFIESVRLTPPRNLLGSPTGFEGDTANPLDVLEDRLCLHAAAPLLAELAKDERDAEAANIAAVTLLMTMNDGVPIPSFQASHGELAPDNALGSFLGESVCPFFEPIVKAEIEFMAPRLADFVKSLIDNENPIVSRNGWMRLRAAAGHGRLPDALAADARAAIGDLVIIADETGKNGDVAILLTVTALAQTHDWQELKPQIDEAFDRLRADDAHLDDEFRQNLFEVAYLRAMLETDHFDRARLLADRIEALSSAPGMIGAGYHVARRFAMGLPGSLAQPFVDCLARLGQNDRGFRE